MAAHPCPQRNALILGQPMFIAHTILAKPMALEAYARRRHAPRPTTAQALDGLVAVAVWTYYLLLIEVA